jgi:UDP-3-O-[3-hydroxymyristoyl] glucosamine N-acyltransferase
MKLSEICEILQLECNLDKDIEITGINTLSEASESEISFLENPKYKKYLKDTKAAAVLIREEDAKDLPSGVIALKTSEPYLKLAYLTKYFAKEPWVDGGYKANESARIDPSARIGKGAKIGKNVVIMPNAVIGPDVEIDEGSVIYPNVTIYRDTKIGKNVKIHAGSVIGSDGFGYAHTKDGRHVKIYHLGKVIIEDDVEIGANTTIDRAVFSKTIIKKGTIIDNLVQIGHNCEVGEYSILVSQVGLAGSTKLGRNVVMGGQSATAGHLEIAPFTQIAARGGVSKSIKEPGVYSGFPLMPHKQWLKLQGLLNRLLKKS